MRLLFIEDEPEAVEPVMKSLAEAEFECQVCNFPNASRDIDAFSPDIIVLDLIGLGGSAEPEKPGLDIFNEVWGEKFCPIVVYSAQPEIYTENRDEHPFVKVVKKGRRSIPEVHAALSELSPHVDALADAAIWIRKQFAIAMRDVAPHAFRTFSNETLRKDAILRSGRRRLAALMDELTDSDQKMATWEQYLCPPISADIQLGDILKLSAGHVTDPGAFRVVLSPSCDLVARGGREPKLKSVLSALCIPVRAAFDGTSLRDMGEKKLRERLPSTVLTQGVFEGIVPLPGLEGRIPPMCADLRKLEFIPIADIGQSDAKFTRVAAIDSPFREALSWAYMQIACRPGLPDRDFDAWRDEIIVFWKAPVADAG